MTLDIAAAQGLAVARVLLADATPPEVVDDAEESGPAPIAQRAEDLFDSVEPIRLKHASPQHIVDLTRDHYAAKGVARENLWTRVSGTERVLTYLTGFPGQDWQSRWDASPLSEAAWADCPALIDEEALDSEARRNQLTAGLSALLLFDVIRPTPQVVLTMRNASLWAQIPVARDDPHVDLLETHGYGTDESRRKASAMLGRLLLLTGKPIAAVTGADILGWRSLALQKKSQTHGIMHLWSALASLEGGKVTGSFHDTTRSPQRTPEELVDQYPIHSRRVRNFFVAYLSRRAASGIDYASLVGVARDLVSWFWCGVEAIQPGIDTLDLPDETAAAWREQAKFWRDGDELIERQHWAHDFMRVRAMYLDVQRWAHDEPEKWAVWACKSPIRKEHYAAYRKMRRRLTSRMHQRTRLRAPLATRLADAAEDMLWETRELLEAATAARKGEVFTVRGKEYRREDAGDEKRAHIFVVPVTDGATRPEQPRRAGGAWRKGAIDLIHAEEDAFWAFCVIETLRQTGARIEEMLELTQMDLSTYQHSDGTVILLHINPSKTDRERVIVVSPELAAVFAQMTRRIREASGVTGQALPSVSAYDILERKALAPMPMLFQRTAGKGIKGSTRAMTKKYVHAILKETCRRANLTGPDGEVVQFTPHDFRRIFATDALASGMPPHIIAKLMGHESLATTQQYMAIYPEEVIHSHRAFIAHRRALPERRDEYRAVTAEEWEQFSEHFGKRQIAIGACMRAYGSSCSHEYACEQCNLARPDESARPRLERVLASLNEQLEEAAERDWKGEIERLTYIRTAVLGKIEDLDRAARRIQVVSLPMPTVRPAGVP
jgi:integrase